MTQARQHRNPDEHETIWSRYFKQNDSSIDHSFPSSCDVEVVQMKIESSKIHPDARLRTFRRFELSVASLN